MTREDLKLIIREVILEMQKEKKKLKYSPEAKERMAIFYKRNELLSYKRKDYWESSEALAKFGKGWVENKLKELDSMTEFKPEISNPSDLRNKWNKIKAKEIIKSNFKTI